MTISYILTNRQIGHSTALLMTNYLPHLIPIGLCQLLYNSDLTALPVNIVEHFNPEIMLQFMFLFIFILHLKSNFKDNDHMT